MVKRRWRCKAGEQPTELDKRIMYLENKGALVPTPDLIKTPEQIEGIRRAGVVNTGVLDAVGRAIHAGMSTLEIDQICRDYCAKHNATPACLNYGGDEETPPFPMSVCTSINEVVCHGVPKADDILEEGDIINVDFTTILDGYYADASRMYIIGKTSPEKEQLVRVAKECLEIGMEAAKPWGYVNEIGIIKLKGLPPFSLPIEGEGWGECLLTSISSFRSRCSRPSEPCRYADQRGCR